MTICATRYGPSTPRIGSFRTQYVRHESSRALGVTCPAAVARSGWGIQRKSLRGILSGAREEGLGSIHLRTSARVGDGSGFDITLTMRIGGDLGPGCEKQM